MKKIHFIFVLLTCLFFTVSAQETETESPYRYVAKMPEYPGGQVALNQYLITHIKYPAAARDAGADGTVLVEFVVEKDGSVSNVKTVVSVYPPLDEEAMRVVREFPRWIPGEDSNGNKVRVYYNIPIRFQLEPSKPHQTKKEKKRGRK